MITTVTMNPCNDKTVHIPEFVYGGKNRVSAQTFSYSGKGFNVSRAIARMSGDTTATGFLYESGGPDVKQSLESDNVNVECIWKPGAIRTNLKIFDEKQKTITEVNESGVFTSVDDLQELFAKIMELAHRSEYMVLSGSLPPGVPNEVYGIIIEKCRPFCRMLLDAEGDILLKGVVRKPFLIKPNLFELEQAVATTLPTIEFIKEAAMSIIREGVGVVAVSLGGNGAIITDGDTTYFSPAIKGVEVLGTVGAGDCMMGGFCQSLTNGLALDEMLRVGVAAATSCVSHQGSELLDLESMQRYYRLVEIEEI